MMTKKLALVLAFAGLALLAACDAPEPRKTDAELGLNPTQASGRHIFDHQCGMCHAAYSGREYKGPSLQGMYKKPYLHTGAPANDDRVRDIIAYGRAKMPAFNRTLNDDQIDKVIVYLHTL
jgi:mono/diheme cytochrome c family protein